MLQHVLVERIERMYRLRLLYGIHLALYGVLLTFCVLTPAQWQQTMLLLLWWLPVVLLHTAAQSLFELRERCVVYAPAPAAAFNPAQLPVIIYDEDGNRIGGERENLLPG